MKTYLLTFLFLIIFNISFGQTAKVMGDNGMTEEEADRISKLRNEIDELSQRESAIQSILPTVGWAPDCSYKEDIDRNLNELQQTINAYEKTEARGLCIQIEAKYKELNGEGSWSGCDDYDRKLNKAKKNLQDFKECLNNRTNDDNSNSYKEIKISDNNNSSSTNNSSSSSNRTTQNQATSNAINSFSNILESIVQNANESSERNAQIEAQKQADRNAIITERRRDLKDGEGSYDKQNKKTGEWTFYYPQSTAPMSNGLYKDGKKDRLWLVYEDESYRSNFSWILKEAIYYEDGIIKEKLKAKIIRNYFPDNEDPEYLILDTQILENSKGGQSYIGYFIQNNNKGVRTVEGYYNRYGKKEGKWIRGYELKQKTFWGPVTKFTLLAEEYYENGKLEGNQKKYHRNGEISGLFNYKEGNKNGIQKEFYEDGALERATEYKDGKLNGVFKTYHSNGELKSISNYGDDKLLGTEKRYRYDGLEILSDLSKDDKTTALKTYFSKINDHISKAPSGIWDKSDFVFKIIFKPDDFEMVNCTEQIMQKDGTYGTCDEIEVSQNSVYLYLRFKQDDKWGILSEGGKTFIPAEWNHISRYSSHMSDDFFIVEKDYDFNVIDKKGKLMFKSYYDAIDFWPYKFKKEPHFLVMRDWKFGIINEREEILLPFEYDFVGWLHHVGNENGIARVQKNGKWGYINSDLEVIIPIKYDAALPYYDKRQKVKGKDNKYEIKSFAEVTLDGETFIIDSEGNRQ